MQEHLKMFLPLVVPISTEEHREAKRKGDLCDESGGSGGCVCVGCAEKLQKENI